MQHIDGDPRKSQSHHGNRDAVKIMILVVDKLVFENNKNYIDLVEAKVIAKIIKCWYTNVNSLFKRAHIQLLKREHFKEKYERVLLECNAVLDGAHNAPIDHFIEKYKP